MKEYYLSLVLIPLWGGFFLDCLFGEPRHFTHPVVHMGRLISLLEKKLRSPEKTPQQLRRAGLLAVITVCTASAAASAAILSCAFALGTLAGASRTAGLIGCCTAASVLCWLMLAPRSLAEESRKVMVPLLKEKDTEAARQAVSMIVGRDTAKLDREGILRAAVETVAENTSDGVTAPMFWMLFLGVPGLYFYKAVNTMDSMVGYKNETYFDFGRYAAKLDDAVNWLPSRLTALLMTAAAWLLPGFDGRGAWRIWRRDRRKHPSPNSAQTESVCAGALQLQLAGPAYYGGVLHQKPFIGDPLRPIEPADIQRSILLMYATAVLFLLAGSAVMSLFYFSR